MKSRNVRYHLPCSDCGSSDALALYPDHSYCFACAVRTKIGEGGRAEWGGRGKLKDETHKDPEETSLNYQSLIKYLQLSEDLQLTEATEVCYNSTSLSNSTTSTGSNGASGDLSNSRSISKGMLNVIEDVKEESKGSTTTGSTTSTGSNGASGTSGVTEQVLGWRGVSPATMRKYGVTTTVAQDGAPLLITYPYSGLPSSDPDYGAKVRDLTAQKKFYAKGRMNRPSIFGKHVFTAASAEAITITEGELDALSCYEMMGAFPVVSVRSSVSAEDDCRAEYDYINSFKKIVVCFDNDEPGSSAAKKVAALFDVNKVFVVSMGGTCKDANDYLVQAKTKEFYKAWWNAKGYKPKGIISSYEEIRSVLEKSGSDTVASYPFSTLDAMTYGIRFSEFVLFKAQEKIGKTEVMRALEHHLLKTTKYNLGLIHLEEKEKRCVEGLLSYELNVPCHLPDSAISIDEKIEGYKHMVGVDNRLHIYSHFGSDDPNVILDLIRYMVVVNKCKFIFLDHITLLVTGFELDDDRKKLDYISTRLAMMTKELDFTLFLVSHVNDDGKTRSSRNIAKVADLIIYLDRDIKSTDYDKRHTTFLTVEGNRFSSGSGPAGALVFDPRTYKIREKAPGEIAVEVPF